MLMLSRPLTDARPVNKVSAMPTLRRARRINAVMTRQKYMLPIHLALPVPPPRAVLDSQSCSLVASFAKLFRTMQQGVRRFFHRNDVAIVQPDNRRVLNEHRAKVIKRLRPHFSQGKRRWLAFPVNGKTKQCRLFHWVLHESNLGRQQYNQHDLL